MLKVFGHSTPDTDSTCSAIAYAWLLSECLGRPATAYVQGPINKESAYVLEHFSVPIPPLLGSLQLGDKVVIVDTNNPEELPRDFDLAELVEVVDHHKLSGLTTVHPVTMTLRPVACTATIIWQIAQESHSTKLPTEIAGMLLAALLSDTLKFTSPTTTDADKLAGAELATMAGVDNEVLAQGMFEAKSDLTGMDAEALLLSDSKVFSLGERKLRISSLETTKPQYALAMKDELITAMQNLKISQGLDGIFLFIVNILSSEATLLVPSDFEKHIAEKGFAQNFDAAGIMPLPGIVSRKKQMLPGIEKGL